LALDQADLVFAPSAATERQAAYKWRIALQHNAMINGIPWLRLNRIEPPFYADSFVVSAGGEIIHEFNIPEERFSLVTLDLRETDQLREQWTFLKDRQPESYRALCEP
jgi:predicted amidohydrolase